MRIAVAADHRGYSAKERVKALLAELGHEVADHGTDSSQSVDYPDVARPAAEAVRDARADRAILICGSGIGVSITANKVVGVRAALCHDEVAAEMSRRHNDANALCVAADWLGEETILRMVRVFLGTNFESGRHQRRLDKLRRLELENLLPASSAPAGAISPTCAAPAAAPQPKTPSMSSSGVMNALR